MLLGGRGNGERWQSGLGVDGLQGRRHLARGRRGAPSARLAATCAASGRIANPPKQELKALARLAGTAEIKRTFPER